MYQPDLLVRMPTPDQVNLRISKNLERDVIDHYLPQFVEQIDLATSFPINIKLHSKRGSLLEDSELHHIKNIPLGSGWSIVDNPYVDNPCVVKEDDRFTISMIIGEKTEQPFKRSMLTV